MTESKESPAREPRSWRTYAHLLAFGLLLALAMILVRGTPGDAGDTGRVVFTEADVAQVEAVFTRTWNRPPTEVELSKAFSQYVRDEILYREAIARNLDETDPTVRLAMVRKITAMGTAQAETADYTDEEVESYFALREESYREPARVDITQIYFSRDKRGERAKADAERLLATLREAEPPPEELVLLGDQSMLDSEFKAMSEQDLDSTLGGQFGAAVLELTPGEWAGPLESGYGLHLVKVTRRIDSRIPELSEIIQNVITDMRFEGRKAAEDQLFAEIAPRYQILYDNAALAALEGGGA